MNGNFAPRGAFQLPTPDPRIESIIEMYWPPRVLRGLIYMPDFDVIPDRPLRFFAYPFNFNLAAQATFQASQAVEHRFWWWGISGNSSLDIAGLPLPFRVKIHDAHTRQPFQTGSLQNPCIVGSGQLPFFMRRPHCFPTQRPINVQVENSANAQNVVQIVLLGAIKDG